MAHDLVVTAHEKCVMVIKKYDMAHEKPDLVMFFADLAHKKYDLVIVFADLAHKKCDLVTVLVDLAHKKCDLVTVLAIPVINDISMVICFAVVKIKRRIAINKIAAQYSGRQSNTSGDVGLIKQIKKKVA